MNKAPLKTTMMGSFHNFRIVRRNHEFGRDGALRRPRRAMAAQQGTRFARHARFVPPALTRAGTSQRDVPTLRCMERTFP